jgi:twitching motility two-component system response regulator PilH
MAIRKIMVVDDSPTERFYYADLLTRSGYTVVTAENGEEALAKAKSDQPELILMDVVMPGQNGFQVTRAISRDPITAHIPIIICTSKDQETDRYWGMKQGAKDYLVKPVNPQELIEKIQSYGN